jgi:hypothetical protein
MAIPEEIYQEFTQGAMLALDKSIGEIRRVLDDVLKAEAEEKARHDEDARLKAEAAKLEEEKKALAEKEAARIAAEKAAADKLKSDRASFEAEKAAFEKKVKAEEEAAKKAAEEEAAKKAAEEEAAKLEAEAAVPEPSGSPGASFQPDNEADIMALVSWADSILDIQAPDVKTDKGKELANHTLALLYRAANNLHSEIREEM